MKSDLIKQTAAEVLFIATLVVLVGSLMPACSTSPKGRKQFIIVPDEQMSTMGVQAFQELKSKQETASDPQVTAYVQCVATAITGSLGDREHQPASWEVVVFKDDTPNAFALPGGKIGVHTGMLKVAQTPSQLAAVIGHEIGHVIARHGSERISEQFATQGGLAVVQATFAGKGARYNVLMGALGLGAQFGILLPHSRTQESEADTIGLDLMAKSGFDPRDSVNLWKNMESQSRGQPPEFLSTHPSHGTRIENLESNMPGALKIYETEGRRLNREKTCVAPKS